MENLDWGAAPYFVDCGLATKLAWLSQLEVLCYVIIVAEKRVNPGVLNGNSILQKAAWRKGWWFLGVCVFWFLEQDVSTFVLLSEDRLAFDMETHRGLKFLWDHLGLCPKPDLETSIWCRSTVARGYGGSCRPSHTPGITESRSWYLQPCQEQNNDQQIGYISIHCGAPGVGERQAGRTSQYLEEIWL